MLANNLAVFQYLNSSPRPSSGSTPPFDAMRLFCVAPSVETELDQELLIASCAGTLVSSPTYKISWSVFSFHTIAMKYHFPVVKLVALVRLLAAPQSKTRFGPENLVSMSSTCPQGLPATTSHFIQKEIVPVVEPQVGFPPSIIYPPVASKEYVLSFT